MIGNLVYLVPCWDELVHCENEQDEGKEGAVAKRGRKRTGAEPSHGQSSRFSSTRSRKGQDQGQGAPTDNRGQSNGGVIELLWFAVLTTFSFVKGVYRD